MNTLFLNSVTNFIVTFKKDLIVKVCNEADIQYSIVFSVSVLWRLQVIGQSSVPSYEKSFECLLLFSCTLNCHP